MFAVVDLETTGGNPGIDKIIEIAIYIHDGATIKQEYSSLVNPEVPIPSFISRLTNITDEMVAKAPLFSDIAEEVASILGQNIFVAHNVMFDYSFLSVALAQEGHHYENKMLCTCKTSRLLLPGFPSYSLSKLCHSLDIDLNNAHRASDDAKATAKILDMLITRSGGVLDPYFSRKEKPLNRSRIPDEQLEILPGKTGVLFFYDQLGNVVYLAKSGNIRKKAWTIINKFHNKRYSGVAATAVAVDYQATGSELLASILEIELITKLQPRYNRKIRAVETRFSIYEDLNDAGYLVLEKKPYFAGANPLITFSNEKETKQKLEDVIERFHLHPAKELNQTNGQLLLESPEIYNQKATEAVKELLGQVRNFMVTGRGPKADCLSMVTIKNGKYAGYLFNETTDDRTSLNDLLESIIPGNDHPAIFKTIVNFVSKGRYLKIINF